jgi:hypothetical protein
LVPCKARCSFIQYIPSKPDKFGIKLWALVENESKYVLNMDPYLGQINEIRAKNVGEQVVKNLARNYMNRGYNITMDNFFTSLQLARYLKGLNTTLVGTIRRNKPYLPAVCSAKKRDLNESSFFENNGNIILFS